MSAQAQLVADGQIAILDAVTTNIADNVTIGTNGNSTLLVITNAASVTNSGMVSIGFAANATNNRVAVGGAGSSWNNGGISFNIGYSGSFNELDVVNGGVVSNSYGYIGYQSPSSNNTVLISGSGSAWQSANLFLGQSGGAKNQLIISNGGRLVSSMAILGSGFGRSNSVIVTGANSVWTNANGLSIGAYGSNSLFMVTNGGKVFSGNMSGLGMLGASSVSNLAVITDAGSTWNCSGSFYIGNFSSRNELDILNGGKITALNSFIGQNPAASNNLVVVSGAGSIWTNGGVFLGASGSRNSLIITNGGQVYNPNNSYVAQSPQSSNNTVVISGTGSLWNSGYFHFGYINPGGNRLTIDKGGQLLIPASVYDHGSYCSSNLATVADAGSSLQCQILRIAYSSTGNECVVSNGANLAVLGIQPSVIQGTSTRVTITGAGTLWTNAADLQFGQDSNVLAILNGGRVVDNSGYIETGSGSPSGKPNTVIVAGTNSVWNNLGDLHMMVENGAQLLITNGGTVINNTAYIDDFSSSTYTISPGLNCYVLVSGLNSLWTNRLDLYLGYQGATNLLVVSDFGTVMANNLYIGNAFNRSQMVVSNSGRVSVRNQLQIGNSNSKSNSVVISGGTLAVTNTVSLNNSARLTLNAGIFRANFLSIFATSNQFTFNGGIMQLTTSHCFDSSPLVIGDGTSAATFEMLNGGSHIFPGGVGISANALLKGAGTVSGNISVNNGGTIAPGTSNLGAIVASGNLTLNPGSTNLMKLSGLSAASDSVTGITNLVYGGTLQLTNLDGSLAAGNSFKLFDAINYSGAFSNLLPASPGAGLRWNTNELTVDGVLRVFPITTPPPAIGSATTVDGNLVVRATGGIPYDPCYLLTSTNLPATPADWSCVATNYFDASGSAGFTNAIPATDPQRYFQLQVN